CCYRCWACTRSALCSCAWPSDARRDASPGSDERGPMDAIQRFTENIVRTTYDMLPASALAATKMFILDTLGVCVAGSTAPGVTELVSLLRGWGGTAESTLLIYGGKLPAPWAAMANSVMMHNLEFDCVHDSAVIHPFTTALPAALAVAEAQGGVSGT